MNNFQRYLADEFAEDYTEGRITRRQALKLIASVTGNLLLAQTILAACAAPPQATSTGVQLNAPTSTQAPPPSTTAATDPTAEPTPAPDTAPTQVTSGTVAPDDPDITAGPVEFLGEGDATIYGYLAQPKGDGPFAVVLVCHENRGLTDHIRDVTRRVAKAGYVGLAVDLLSRQGGSDVVGIDNVPGALGNTPPDFFVADFKSGWNHLKTLPNTDADRVGMTGFCFGGGVTWQVATRMPELKAAVPFYGPPPDQSEVPNINAPVLAIYGELDSRITSSIPAIEAAMQQNGKIYEKAIYPGADHAFHNDTSTRYNPEAARDAWARTLAWFGTYLV